MRLRNHSQMLYNFTTRRTSRSNWQLRTNLFQRTSFNPKTNHLPSGLTTTCLRWTTPLRAFKFLWTTSTDATCKSKHFQLLTVIKDCFNPYKFKKSKIIIYPFKTNKTCNRHMLFNIFLRTQSKFLQIISYLLILRPMSPITKWVLWTRIKKILPLISSNIIVKTKSNQMPCPKLITLKTKLRVYRTTTAIK